MTVEFQLEGQDFIALKGGEEGPCGWLKDKHGLSWQIVPTVLTEMLKDEDAEEGKRVTRAMLQMKKLDIETLKRAYEGA
ncbi:MAG TPA: VOC family protein [Pyrinomonadaceae bacterium]|nr:VOC family protein [Pyrinomonadaceae bacterium]